MLRRQQRRGVARYTAAISGGFLGQIRQPASWLVHPRAVLLFHLRNSDGLSSTYNFVLQRRIPTGPSQFPDAFHSGWHDIYIDHDFPANGTIGSTYSTNLTAAYGILRTYSLSNPASRLIPCRECVSHESRQQHRTHQRHAARERPRRYIVFQVTDSTTRFLKSPMPRLKIFFFIRSCSSRRLPARWFSGTPYSATLQGTGGLKPYTWSVPPGALPLG